METLVVQRSLYSPSRLVHSPLVVSRFLFIRPPTLTFPTHLSTRVPNCGETLLRSTATSSRHCHCHCHYQHGLRCWCWSDGGPFKKLLTRQLNQTTDKDCDKTKLFQRVPRQQPVAAQEASDYLSTYSWLLLILMCKLHKATYRPPQSSIST